MRRAREYGNVRVGQGERVQVEFVSVNPTGPLHVAHARGAVIGSTLANVLSAAGYDVEREYYINDAGNQMDKFNESLFARYQQLLGNPAEFPEEGYVGGYMVDLAREIREAEGDRFADAPPTDAISELGGIGLRMMLDDIREDLEALRIDFDVWFSERSLYRCGQYDRGVELLRQRGQLAERDGATWFEWEESGDHKQAVVVRTNGTPTYFASDIAYHFNKFVERGFDRVIDVWGADHQGHVARMKAVVDALGIPPERLTLLLNQLVTLRRGDELVRLSKRSGEIVTLRELVEEVGADACRFFFLSRSAESQMEFDLELAKQQSSENPVYYVQYAHARIASILSIAEERGHRLLGRPGVPSHARSGAGTHTEGDAVARGGGDDGHFARAAPPAALRGRTRHGLPLVLPAVPRHLRRGGGGGRHEGAAEAGRRREAHPGPLPAPDGRGGAAKDVRRGYASRLPCCL